MYVLPADFINVSFALYGKMAEEPSPNQSRKDLSPPSSLVSNPIVTFKLKVSYPQALEAPFPSKKDKQRYDIVESSKQVKINPSLLEAIKRIIAYAKFLKDMCTFKENLEMTSLERLL